MAKVLLVEDDNNLREIYEARLAAEGYEISSAQDGEEALVVAKQQKPDLVISDVMMPKISGFEMLDILRNTQGLEHVKVIMLTALGQSEDRDRADSLGADKYLVKSQVTLEDIVKTAQELLGGDDDSAAQALPATAVTSATSDSVALDEPAAPAATGSAEPAEPVSMPVAAPPTPTDDSTTADSTADDTTVADPASSDDAPATDDSTADDTAVPEAPLAAADVTVPADSEDTATDRVPTTDSANQPGSAAQEEALVQNQINSFVDSAPTANPPAEADVAAVAEPAAPSSDAEPSAEQASTADSSAESSTTGSTDDKLMSDAADELASPDASVDSDDQAESTAEPAPATDSSPETSPTDPASSETTDNDSDQNHITINGKKTIQPIDSVPKPDINELLAREAPDSDPSQIVTGDATGKPGDDSPTDAEPTTPPAPIHQPGQSFAPQSPPDDAQQEQPSSSPAVEPEPEAPAEVPEPQPVVTEAPVEEPAVEPSDAVVVSPQPAASPEPTTDQKSDDFDPNSVAL